MDLHQITQIQFLFRRKKINMKNIFKILFPKTGLSKNEHVLEEIKMKIKISPDLKKEKDDFKSTYKKDKTIEDIFIVFPTTKLINCSLMTYVGKTTKNKLPVYKLNCKLDYFKIKIKIITKYSFITIDKNKINFTDYKKINYNKLIN